MRNEPSSGAAAAVHDVRTGRDGEPLRRSGRGLIPGAGLMLLLLFPGPAHGRVFDFSPPDAAGKPAARGSDPGAGRGGTAAVPEGRPAPTAAAGVEAMESPDYRRFRQEGYDRLYNMDYAGARARFLEMTRLAPGHPAAYFYLATTSWLEILNSSRRLQTNLYAGKSFFSQNPDKVDPRTDRDFRQLIAAAQARAEAAVKAGPGDAAALYYLGAVHGLLASYEGTVARSFLPALRHGVKSVDMHREVLKLDPRFIDATLSIGCYDYVVGSLPFFFKILAAIGGYRGSKEKGLETLRTLAAHGRYANDDARVALLTFYSRDRRWADSLQILNDLAAKYPRNGIFKLEQAGMLIRLGRHAESGRLFNALLQDETMAGLRDQIHYQYGDALLAQHRPADALPHFQAVAALPGASSDMATLSRLKAGQTLDLLGRRAEALAEYQAVSHRANVFDSREQAEEYLKTPFRQEE